MAEERGQRERRGRASSKSNVESEDENERIHISLFAYDQSRQTFIHRSLDPLTRLTARYRFYSRIVCVHLFFPSPSLFCC